MSAHTTPRALRFNVHGVPAPQAGMKAVPTNKGARLVTTGGQGLLSWRNAVTAQACLWAAGAAVQAKQRDMFPLTGPVSIQVVFRLPMPASRPKKVRDLGTAWCTVKPDTDKLMRAIGDSLVAAAVLCDDNQIAHWSACKVETTEWTGAVISIDQLDPFVAAPGGSSGGDPT